MWLLSVYVLENGDFVLLGCYIVLLEKCCLMFVRTGVSIFRVRQSMKYSQCRRLRQCEGVVVMVPLAIFQLVIFYSVPVFSEAEGDTALIPY